MKQNEKIAIIGAGNIGTAIAQGLEEAHNFETDQIYLTRRRIEFLEEFEEKGFLVQRDNVDAVKNSSIILLTVEPQHINAVLNEINPHLDPGNHLLISVAAGVAISKIKNHLTSDVPVVRAMPNTAIAIRESMTCLASDIEGNGEYLKKAKSIFDTVGKTEIIEEEQMIPATALGACGIAFFLRSIRAASQGGIETGMHSKQALTIAAQTARGAANLLQELEGHPEQEIDKVTTPLGCTIAGLNQLEHNGFSSSIIQGIKTSADIAGKLYEE